MIFVILGTQKFQMNRLLKLLDNLIADNKIDESVVAQIGLSDYEPQHMKFYRTIEKKLFDNLISEADLIITHGGVGAIISALKQKKPVIVCPRIAKFGEQVDDHQWEIARSFENKGYVRCYYDENDDLPKLINISKSSDFREYIPQKNNITAIINNYLTGIKK